MLWLSILVFLFLVFVVSNGGYEATPLQVGCVPLSVGRSILHQRGRQMLSFPLDMGVTFTPPLLCLTLPTMTQFCEWSHSSWGSLSASINGHWCCSLCLTYVFLLRSAATSHYLRSSPVLSGCSSRHWWQKSQLPIFPPQGSSTGRSSGDHLTIFLLWCPLSFTSCRGSLAWNGTGTHVPCMMAAHTQGNTNLWCNEKKLVSVEDLWPSMLVHHFIRGDVSRNLMHHLPSLFFPPILDLPLSLKSIHLH